MEISRRSILTTGLGAVVAGAASQLALPSVQAASFPVKNGLPVSSFTADDLNLNIWDRVVRPMSNSDSAVLKVTSGKLPEGLSIAGRFLTGKLTSNEKYYFELVIEEGSTVKKKIFSGQVNLTKQDLTISVSLDSSTPMSVYAKELDKIKAIGANVVLVVLDYIKDEKSYSFTRVSNSRVSQWFALAAERSVRVVMLKPHIATVNSGDGFYRGDYQPSSVSGFFTNWEKELIYFTQLATANNVEYLCLTCEQRWQTEAEHYPRWVNIITNIRNTNPTLKLTAAFTTLELYLLYTYWAPQGVPHMAQMLDVYGINSWVRLTNKVYTPNKPNITVNELAQGWNGKGGLGDNHLEKLNYVCNYLKIPFFITEVGVQPRVDGLSRQEGGEPWPSGAWNHDVQALLFSSIFQAPMLSQWCTGVSIWHMRDPFNIGDVNSSNLYPGEVVLQNEIKRKPGLVKNFF